MARVFIRTAEEHDYAAIARIQNLAPEAAQWPVGDYANFSVLVAVSDTEIAGFCAFRQTVPEESEVLNIAVAPGQRRKGFGRLLLQELCNHVTGDIYLEVAADNVAAQELYLGLGWTRIAVRPGYYQRGAVDGLVMKKSSC